jgi:hypothetical protein
MKKDQKALGVSKLAGLRSALGDVDGEARVVLTRTIAFIEAMETALNELDMACSTLPTDKVDARVDLANAHLAFMKASAEALMSIGDDSCQRYIDGGLSSLPSKSAYEVYGTNAYLPELLQQAYENDLALPDHFVGPKDSRMERALAIVSLLRNGHVDRGDSVRNAITRIRKKANEAEYMHFDSQASKFTADPVIAALNGLPGKRGRPKKAN